MKNAKVFVTRDDFIDNNDRSVSSLFELSDYALTFSSNRKLYYYNTNPLYSIYLFNTDECDSLTNEEATRIGKMIDLFQNYLNQQTVIYDKRYFIVTFLQFANNVYNNLNIVDFDFDSIITKDQVRGVNYLSATFNDLSLRVSLWCNYQHFELFYPNYEVKVVLPLDNLVELIRTPNLLIDRLNKFDLVEFNKKIDLEINKEPPSHVKILNIPYVLSSANVKINTYFGFIIYGAQGNYDFILKAALRDYLISLGMTQSDIETYFPDMLKTNEFFIVPRWDKVAIPSQVGQNAINSQIAKSYTEVFDLDKFIKVYDTTYIKNNTYNVPIDYNNLLLMITNGEYSNDEVKDFLSYYKDLITVNSLHPDFARMSAKTQKFLSMLFDLLKVGDASSSTELLDSIVSEKNYLFRIIKRNEVLFVSILYDQHQYYLLPRYEMAQINANP